MRTCVALAMIFVSQAACASAWKTNAIYDGRTGAATTLAAVVSSLEPGGVAIVSEEHDLKAHHENQMAFLGELANQRLTPVSVGMEFFARPHQTFVDQYLAGTIAEPDFLKAVGWGGNTFANYRSQVLFPRDHAGTTLALNAARTLTGKISKVGIAGLTEKERAELPSGFTLGNAKYYERFRDTMKGHVPEEKIQRYFEAQSTWDETMAFTAAEFLKAHPKQRLVIIVGDFHAAYGGGLPDRLLARGVTQVLTLSQVNLAGLSSHEEDSLMKPRSDWGPRADFVWVSRSVRSEKTPRRLSRPLLEPTPAQP